MKIKAKIDKPRQAKIASKHQKLGERPALPTPWSEVDGLWDCETMQFCNSTTPFVVLYNCSLVK